jgi:hypothetical protein
MRLCSLGACWPRRCLLPIPAQAADVMPCWQRPRQRVQSADFAPAAIWSGWMRTARAPAMASPSRRTGFPACCACWWNCPASKASADWLGCARAHILLKCGPTARMRSRLLIPATRRLLSCPSTSGATARSAPASATRIFLSAVLLAGSGAARRTKFGARDCDVCEEHAGRGGQTHYAEVKTWLDHSIGFPVYVEKTLKGTGTVKEFTYFGLRHEGGVWSATRWKPRLRGQAGSTLLIIDRGSAKQISASGTSAPSNSPVSRIAHASCFSGFSGLGRGPDRRGLLYQWIGGQPRPAALRHSGGAGSTIGGRRKLYLLEKGSGTGRPTVLFEAGIAATNLNWFHIQEIVSRFTGTASYDRGGLGWSSPAARRAPPATSPPSCTTA